MFLCIWIFLYIYNCLPVNVIVTIDAFEYSISICSTLVMTIDWNLFSPFKTHERFKTKFEKKNLGYAVYSKCSFALSLIKIGFHSHYQMFIIAKPINAIEGNIWNLKIVAQMNWKSRGLWYNNAIFKKVRPL